MFRYIISILLATFLLGCVAEAEPPPEACSLKPDPGFGKAHFEKFFYNKSTKSCEVFIWGGDGGTVPFDTLSECETSCLPKQAQTEPGCEFEGTFYAIGDSWPVDCNTCICDRVNLDAPPQMVCTEMVCGNSTIGLEDTEQEYPYTLELKLGESKPIPGGTITFTEVAQDSRCPEGANCIWQGNAKVFLQVEQAESPPATLFIDVTETADGQADIYIYDLYLQLKQLQPTPPNDGQIEDNQYMIELLIDKNTGKEGAPMKPTDTDLSPKAIGPYSQAIESNGLLFISGQIPINPTTQDLQLFDGDVKQQAQLVLSNLNGILTSQALAPSDVIKTTIYITDMNEFQAVNEVYADFFQDHKPARATVEVAALPKGALVEIEAIARVTGD